MSAPASPLVVYVDVDDTIVRSIGTKRIPLPHAIARVRELQAQGATLYCWSTGGADYARQSAEEHDIAVCFTGFLPKPHLLIDYQEPADWKGLQYLHPSGC